MTLSTSVVIATASSGARGIGLISAMTPIYAAIMVGSRCGPVSLLMSADRLGSHSASRTAPILHPTEVVPAGRRKWHPGNSESRDHGLRDEGAPGGAGDLHWQRLQSGSEIKLPTDRSIALLAIGSIVP